ncbi:RimJ/RimL family protein N-acetyltransferase [Bradyrhizobium elkanii]
MTTAIVTIRTARLTLRPQVIEDFPAYHAFLASPRSAGMGGPFDLRAAWGMFCHDLACWRLFGHGALMIELAATRQCVGQVGINHGPLFPEKELGRLLYDGYEGHGSARPAQQHSLIAVNIST